MENESITVRVLFFGAARDVTGHEEIQLSLASATTAESARSQILSDYPNLRRFGNSLLLAVNQEYARPEREIRDGDELALFPPVSGGAEPTPSRINEKTSRDFFELTDRPVDVGSVVRRVVLPECGATVTLDGYAREWTKGRRTLYLVYEAYDSLALTEMQHLGREAHKLFEIAHV